MWRPIVKRRIIDGHEIAFCGGRAVTVENYGTSYIEESEKGLPQHREQKEEKKTQKR